MRKMSPSSSRPVSTVEVAAGEMSGMPAATTSGASRSTSTDEFGPMTTSTGFVSRSANDASAVWVPASAESAWNTSTGAPFTPPASLISAIARLTPAAWAPPRNANVPLVGTRSPILSTPSPVGWMVMVGSGVTVGSAGGGAVHAARSAVEARATTHARTSFGRGVGSMLGCMLERYSWRGRRSRRLAC